MRFEDGADGQAFAESLPAEIQGEGRKVPCWWKTYCDGEVVRLWSAGYGFFNIPALALQGRVDQIIQRVQDARLDNPGRFYVRHYDSCELSDVGDNEYFFRPDNQEGISIIINDMRFIPEFPDDTATDEVKDAWGGWYMQCLYSLMRFKVYDSMYAESWPGDHEELTEDLEWAEMIQRPEAEG